MTCLLGAGATIPVGGPTTWRITEAVRAKTQHVLDPETNVWRDISFIDEIAIALNRFLDPAECHFEDIFDTLENLQSLHSGWQRETVERFKPRIGAFVRDTDPRWFNPMWLLAAKQSLLEVVAEQIEESSANFQPSGVHAWFRSFWGRAFDRIDWDLGTLNYDNLFEQMNPGLEDGYERPVTKSRFNRDRLFKTKRSRILHLHGSIHFGYLPHVERSPFTEFEEDLIRYESAAEARRTWFGKSTPVSQSHQDLVIGPLITGLRKTDKLTVHPYDEYQAVFRTALYKSQRLLIIGYSFGDLYLNSILNRMLGVHGSERRIVIVTQFPGRPEQWFPDAKVLFQDHRWPNVDMFQALATAMNSVRPLGASNQFHDRLVSEDGCCQLYLAGTQRAIEDHGDEILEFLTK